MRKVLRIAHLVTGEWLSATAAVALLAACAIEPPPVAVPEHKPPTDTALLAAPPAEKPVEVEKPALPLPPFAVPPPPKPQALQVLALAAPQPAPPAPPIEPVEPIERVEPVKPTEPAMPIEPPVPTPRPEALVGLDPAQTESLLGPPTAVREMSPATIWSYTTSNCKLDLYFYMNMASKRLSALSYELKNQDGQANDVLASQCLRQLTEAGRNVLR